MIPTSRAVPASALVTTPMRREITLHDLVVTIEAPEAPDEIVRAEEAAGDAEAGYWACLWPSALRLAEVVARSPLVGPGVRVLEIGCGLGLAGIVAGLRGAAVVMTDVDARAVDAARQNAALNNVAARAERFDWRDEPDPQWRPDVIIGADVLYFESAHAPIARLIASAGCVAVLVDPNRPRADGAPEVFERAGLACWVSAIPGGRVMMVQRH